MHKKQQNGDGGGCTVAGCFVQFFRATTAIKTVGSLRSNRTIGRTLFLSEPRTRSKHINSFEKGFK